MFDKLFDKVFKYDGNQMLIIFDMNGMIWFKAKDVAIILKYKETERAIQTNVEKENKKHIEQFDHKIRPENIANKTLFINEFGLYSLMLNSRLPEAKKFTTWIIREVIPEIIRTGQYIANEELRKELFEINRQLEEYKNRVDVLENNQKKTKYGKGGYIYILQLPNLNKFVKNLYKIGKTLSMNKRMYNYDTASPDKIRMICSIKVSNPEAMEYCLKAKLHPQIYRKNKEYYKCALKVLIDGIDECVKFTNDKCFGCNECRNKSNNKNKIFDHLNKNHKIDLDKVGGYKIIY